MQPSEEEASNVHSATRYVLEAVDEKAPSKSAK